MSIETKENLERFFTLYPGIKAGWELENPDKIPEQHWFLSSVTGWNVDTDLLEAIKLRKREDALGLLSPESCSVYLVPGPIEREYRINQYTPQVDGIVFIAKLNYPKKKGRGKPRPTLK